jgi:hypothetical protein
MTAEPVAVDDSHTDKIRYSDGQWVASGQAAEYNSTSHCTNSKGATATFLFNGEDIEPKLRPKLSCA